MGSQFNFNHYETYLFDCDGVILNSNSIKTEAFYETALPYGRDAALELVEYHVRNGGVSRYEKFDYFLRCILKNGAQSDFDELVSKYASKVFEGLMKCEVSSGLTKLKDITKGSAWMIVSGGDQEELGRVFKARRLDKLFELGIYGSPDSKSDILHREVDSGNIKRPSIFFGDSKYDFKVSREIGLDFIFLTKWTEVADWKDWVKQNDIKVFESLATLAGAIQLKNIE